MVTSVLPFDTNIALFGVAAIAVCVAVYCYTKYTNIKNISPIAEVEAQCKVSGNPMIKVSDPSGKFEVYEGITKDVTDVTYKQKGVRGLQVRPDLLNNVEVEWTPARVPMYSYTTDFHFTISSKAGRALITAIEYIREKHPELDFITDDLELIEAIFTDSEALTKDCETFLTAYEQDESRLSADDLKNIFEDLKKEIPNIPLKKGYYSMKQAMALIPEGTTAQEMSRFGDEILKGERLNTQQDYQKLMMWVFIACCPIALVVLGILITKVF